MITEQSALSRALTEATTALVEQISDADLRERAMKATAEYLAVVLANPAAMQPLIAAIPIALAINHVALGAPLYLNDTLLWAWLTDGYDTQRECPRDGYKQPTSCPVCSVCGSAMGEPGCWAIERTRTASLN